MRLDWSDATKVIKLQLWGSSYLSDPSQDERGGGAGPAGHRGDDGAAHLPGRDLPQVNKQLSSDQADVMNDIETLLWSIPYSRHVVRSLPMCQEGLSPPAVTLGVRPESGDFL